MKFQLLHENLRKAVASRISAGALTQLKLAGQTGFQQAHISNFLHKKRQLSMDGLDRVLSVLQLSVLDLLDPAEINKRASIVPPSQGDFENVLMVEGEVAAVEPIITNEHVKDILMFKKSFLHRLRSDMASKREGWYRFVLCKIDARDGTSMYPRLLPGSTVLIDRHYNSLLPYRKGEANMYAVRTSAGGGCTVKYVELTENHLVLRPHNQSYPVSVIAVAEKSNFADHIIGRICHVANEV